MNSGRLRMWTIAMPVIAVAVSSSIVGWEHARRDRLTHRLAAAEKEYTQLIAHRPAAGLAKARAAESQRHDTNSD